MLRQIRRKYIDVDDTAVRTTHDLQGDTSRVDTHLSMVPGFDVFLQWSPLDNVLLSCTDVETELAAALQEKKIAKFGLIEFFSRERGGEIHICSGPEAKREMLERLVRESGFDPDEQAVIGDRPNCELSKGIELGLQVYRMRILKADGAPEGKYGTLPLYGPHVEVHDWLQLKEEYPNLRSAARRG